MWVGHSDKSATIVLIGIFLRSLDTMLVRHEPLQIIGDKLAGLYYHAIYDVNISKYV